MVALVKSVAIDSLAIYGKGIEHVIDIRLKFGLDSLPYNEQTCIVVVDITDKSGNKIMVGIVVDSVSEVLNIKGGYIEDTPTFGAKLNTDYILGMAKMGGRIKILLDIDKVLSAEEVTILDKAA